METLVTNEYICKQNILHYVKLTDHLSSINHKMDQHAWGKWLIDIIKCQWTSHYSDVIMGVMASQITSLTFIYSSVYSGANQRQHQSSVSLAFVRGIHRWPANSPHKGPVTPKMFPFDDVIMHLQAWSSFVMNTLSAEPLFDAMEVYANKSGTSFEW